jgi:hypothetical protein
MRLGGEAFFTSVRIAFATNLLKWLGAESDRSAEMSIAKLPALRTFSNPMNTQINPSRRFTVFLLLLPIFGMSAAWYFMQASKVRAILVVSQYKAPPKVEADSSLSAELGSPAPITQLQTFPSNAVGGFLNGRVENGTSNDLRRVTLELPSPVYVCLQHRVTPPTCVSSTANIDIGNMKPLESVALQVWLPYQPNVSVYREIRLVHSKGSGRVTLEAVELPSGFVRDNYPTVIFLTALILYFLHVYFARRYVERQLAVLRKSQPDNKTRSGEHK